MVIHPYLLAGFRWAAIAALCGLRVLFAAPLLHGSLPECWWSGDRF